MPHQSASSGTVSCAICWSAGPGSIASPRSRPASTSSRRPSSARWRAVTSSITFMTSAARPSCPPSAVAFIASHCCRPVARVTRRSSVVCVRAPPSSACIQARPESPTGRPSASNSAKRSHSSPRLVAWRSVSEPAPSISRAARLASTTRPSPSRTVTASSMPSISASSWRSASNSRALSSATARRPVKTRRKRRSSPT